MNSMSKRLLDLPLEIQDDIATEVVKLHNRRSRPLSSFRLASKATCRLADRAIHRDIRTGGSSFSVVHFNFTAKSFEALLALRRSQFWMGISTLHLDLEVFDLDLERIRALPDDVIRGFSCARHYVHERSASTENVSWSEYVEAALQRQAERHRFLSKGNRSALSRLQRIAADLEVTLTLKGCSSTIASSAFRVYRKPWSCPDHVDHHKIDFLGLRTLLNMWPASGADQRECSNDVAPSRPVDEMLTLLLARPQRVELHATSPCISGNLLSWTDNMTQLTVVLDDEPDLAWELPWHPRPFEKLIFRVRDGFSA